jgi:hypothetical protein
MPAQTVHLLVDLHRSLICVLLLNSARNMWAMTNSHRIEPLLLAEGQPPANFPATLGDFKNLTSMK